MSVIQGFLKEKVQRPRAIYGEGVCECAWVVGGLVVGILKNSILIREIIVVLFGL